MHAQLIVPGELIQEKLPTFNEDSIAERGIRSITLRMLRKPSSKPIYDDGKRAIYRFNRRGRLVELIKIYPGRYGVLDTSIIQFTYMGSELVKQLERVGSYQRLTKYSHPDKETTEISIEVKRGRSPWQLIREERLKEKENQTAHGIVRETLRGGLDTEPYQRTIERYNGHERITSREVWNGNRSQSLETWVWQGDLISGYFKNDLLEAKNLSIEYSLDAPRQEEGKWCSDECLNWSIVHHKDGKPKGWLFMNPETENMEIWEFDYDLFDTANR